MLNDNEEKMIGQKNQFDKNLYSCDVCFISFSPILPCKCNICEDCIFNWIATKNFEILFTKEQYLKCPNKTCKKEISIAWLSQNLNSKNFLCIDKILFRKYLNTADDTRKCPNKYCTNVGWVDTTKKCADLVQCQLCLSSWLDYSIINYKLFYKLILYIKNLKENLRNDLSELVVLVISKSCPNCGIRIYKIEGCDHVICSNCNEEFCYNCTGSYNDHNEAQCLAKYLVIVITAMFIISIILLKILYSLSWLRLGIYYFFCFTWFNILSSCFVFVNYLVIKHVFNLLCTKFNLVYFLMLGVHVLSLVYSYFMNDFLFLYANYFITEIIVLCAVGGLGYCLRERRYKNFF